MSGPSSDDKEAGERALVSFVIPAVRHSPELAFLVAQVAGLAGTETVVINQTAEPRFSQRAGVLELVLPEPVPASHARNAGARAATGEFVFFLDDDACFVEGCERDVVSSVHANRNCPVLLFDRCHRIGEAIISHNPPPSEWRRTHWVMTKYMTEWNICVRRSDFLEAGGFPPIGVGSPHRAQSGEAFVLFARLIHRGATACYLPQVRVVHPDYATTKPLRRCLGYYFGSGYAVGIGLRGYPASYRALWYARTVAASLRDLVLPIQRLLRPAERTSVAGYKLLIAYSRLAGLLAGTKESLA